MSVLMRRIILCVIGLLAGLASWPALETLLMTQSSFPSLLVFSVFIGIIFGVFMGGFFGSGEGIIISVKKKLVSGIATGAVIGIVGGTVGFLVGQAALFFTGEYLVHSSRNFNTFGFPVSRAVGWAFLGIFIGMVEGVRAGSFDKIKVGMAGGLAGGFIGGLGLEYFRLLLPDIMLARLLGLLIFGGFIGFFYGLLEDRMSFGVLRVLNGRLRGKEFLVNQRRLRQLLPGFLQQLLFRVRIFGNQVPGPVERAGRGFISCDDQRHQFIEQLVICESVATLVGCRKIDGQEIEMIDIVRRPAFGNDAEQ